MDQVNQMITNALFQASQQQGSFGKGGSWGSPETGSDAQFSGSRSKKIVLKPTSVTESVNRQLVVLRLQCLLQESQSLEWDVMELEADRAHLVQATENMCAAATAQKRVHYFHTRHCQTNKSNNMEVDL